MEGQERQNIIIRSSSDRRIEIEDHVDELEHIIYAHEPGSRPVAKGYLGYAVLLGDFLLKSKGILKVKNQLENAFGKPLTIDDRVFMTAALNKIDNDYRDRLPTRFLNDNHLRSKVTSYNLAISSEDRSHTFLLHVSPLDAIYHAEVGLFDEYSSVMAAHTTISMFGMINSETYVKPYAVIGSLKAPSPFGNAGANQNTRNTDAEAWNVVRSYCDYLDIRTIMIPPDLKKYN